MEVEVKVRIDSPAEMEKSIVDMGAYFLKEVVEEDTYFSHPCRDFSTTDEALRIRNGSSLTYKGPKVDMDTKSREEHIVHFDSEMEMRGILSALGFREVARVRKRRRYYRIGDVTISLDTVDHLGHFVEVECIGEYGECREKVMEVCEKLHLKEFIRKSYLELLLEKENQRGTT